MPEIMQILFLSLLLGAMAKGDDNNAQFDVTMCTGYDGAGTCRFDILDAHLCSNIEGNPIGGPFLSFDPGNGVLCNLYSVPNCSYYDGNRGQYWTAAINTTMNIEPSPGPWSFSSFCCKRSGGEHDGMDPNC